MRLFKALAICKKVLVVLTLLQACLIISGFLVLMLSIELAIRFLCLPMLAPILINNGKL